MEYDDLRLSDEAQKALAEFYRERNEKLLSHCDDKKDIEFDEDWVGLLWIQL